MRDTKFRGKRIDNGEWVYGYYVYCRHHAYILPIYNEDDPDPCFDERWIQEGADDEGWIEVIPETVGQFTGLKDKSGVEIYEGDIIKGIDRASDLVWAKENGYWGKVVIGDTSMPINGGEYEIEYYGVYIQTEYKTNEFMTSELLRGKIEVIGNIHENKDLLNEK